MGTDMQQTAGKGELFKFLALLILLLFIVALLQLQIEYLATSHSFYGWLLARITEAEIIMPILPDETEEEITEESALFEEVKVSIEAEAGKAVSDLSERQLWSLVLEEMKRPTRATFEALGREKKLNLPVEAIDWTEDSVGAHLGSLILGFRIAVADLLWLKVDDYWHQGRIEMMLPMMYTVVRLDPHFIDAWAVGAWHLSYNATVTVDTPEEKRAFIDKAILFLQDGIKRNSRHYQLYFELGFNIYFEKLEEYKTAAYYMEQACRYEHSGKRWVDRMLLHAYELGGEYEKALGGWHTYLEKIDPASETAPRFILQIQAEIAQRDGLEDKAFAIWQEMYDKFPGVNERADIEITKIKARRAEAAGNYAQAKALWQSFIDKIYPSVFDEAMENIARLNVLMIRQRTGTAET